MASSGSPRRRRGLKERLAGLADNIGQLAEAVGNVVSSAGELLVDNDLRRKGANYLVQEAAKNVNEIQRGIEAGAETLQQGAKARLGAGASKVTGLLRNIERQIQEFQRQQQQRDLQAELEHHHKLPVDIQIGEQVFEDMPQEMRSRFWYVLLERPDLAQALRKQHQTSSRQGSARPQATASSAQHAMETLATAAAVAATTAAPAAEAHADSSPTRALSTEQDTVAAAAASSDQQHPSPTAGSGVHSDPMSPLNANTPFAVFDPSQQQGDRATAADSNGAARPMEQPFVAEHVQQQSLSAGKEPVPASVSTNRCTEDSVPDIDDLLSKQSTGIMVPLELPAAGNGSPGDSTDVGDSRSSSHDAAGASPAAAVEQHAVAVAEADGLPVAPSPWGPSAAAATRETSNSMNRSSSPAKPTAPNPWGQAAAAAASAGEQGSTASQPAAAAVAVGDHTRSADDWEMVPSDVPAASVGAAPLEALDNIRALVQQYSEAESVDAARVTQQSVFQAMLEVPWTPGEGVPQEIDPNGEYARWLAAGCGHVEDVILRDVARTFPEHPLFSAHLQGQQRLLRLLKAYAAADPEVGYCQGMAFAAGVLLMYLPEEPAFRLYHRLMTAGPNLRRLYLPGLEPLKMELSRFELLLATHYPELHQHLLDAGLPALLYAAQWYMTTCSCPFPLHVAARVLDILLQSDSDAIMSQLGLAVMGALQDQLLEMDDFEALITYLKVQPLSWPVHTHRQVFADALNSPATEAELKSAAAAVAAEASRLGRFSSFSDRRLAKQDTPGTRHELVPGVLGPRTAAAAAASGSDTAAEAGPCTDTAQQVQLTAEQCQAAGAAAHNVQQQRLDVGVAGDGSTEGAGSNVGLNELDAAFLDLDLNMIMPSAASDSEMECSL